MELFLLYAWMKIDSVISIFCLATVLSGFAIVLWAMAIAIVGKDEIPPMGKWKRILFPVFLISGTIATLAPSSNQTAALVAAHYGLKVMDSPEAAKIVQLARKKANEYLDGQLADHPAKK